MSRVFRPRDRVMRGRKNVMRGGNVVLVLDRLNGKTPISKTKDTKTFSEEIQGGSIERVMNRTNKTGGLPASKKSRMLQTARIAEPVRNKVVPFGGGALDNEAENRQQRLANSLKIPMSFKKNKEKRNNIKLVL
jgi:carbon monoxide dehydrogenase subunit G